MIDINFDFQAEVATRFNCGRFDQDSDRWSPTLQEYHRILWSKPLPNGKLFSLEKIGQNRLLHKSELGEFHLSSDRATTSFRKKFSEAGVPGFEKFAILKDTIGGIVIWPAKKRVGGMTINQARGASQGHKIGDRLDLTVECIRRYYKNQSSPLFETFKRYSDFFDLFGSFDGYIDFFLLQDIVSDDYSVVNITTPFDDFKTSPFPRSIEEYCVYMNNATQFLMARNKRIKLWCDTNFYQA